MKKVALFLGCMLFGGAAFAQTHPYDSLENFLGENVTRYIGQILFLKNNDAARGNNGYNGFAIKADFDLGPNGRNVFRSVQSKTPLQYVSNYGRMAGHYFRVEDVVTRPTKNFTRGGLTHYLEAVDVQTGDRCYIGYESQEPACFNNFVVVGFYDKLRSLCIGQMFTYTGKEPVAYRNKAYVGLQAMNGQGRRTDVKEGSEWKCVDIAIEEGNDYQVIGVLENPQYGQVYTMATDLLNTQAKNAKFQTKGDLKALADKAQQDAELKSAQNAARLAEATQKFGAENARLLANNEVKVGMTKEMCRWAFGGPFNVITVTENGENIEQWFYTNGRYLYFKGDVLIKHTEVAAYKDDQKYFHNDVVQ